MQAHWLHTLHLPLTMRQLRMHPNCVPGVIASLPLQPTRPVTPLFDHTRPLASLEVIHFHTLSNRRDRKLVGPPAPLASTLRTPTLRPGSSSTSAASPCATGEVWPPSIQRFMAQLTVLGTSWWGQWPVGRGGWVGRGAWRVKGREGRVAREEGGG